jgi:hypothetical protein
VISAKTKVNFDLSMSFLEVFEIPSFSDCNLIHKTSIMEKFGIDMRTGDQRSDV